MQGCVSPSGFQLSRHDGLQTEGSSVNYLSRSGLYLDDRRVIVLPLFDINCEDVTFRSVDRCESLNVQIKKDRNH